MNPNFPRSWRDRLKSKILEKRSSATTLINAGLHGLGTGGRWGAGLGAAYGAGRAVLSDDPDASIVGGALKGGTLGGLAGAGLGLVGGPAVHYGPSYAGDLKRIADKLLYPGLAGASDKARVHLQNLREALKLKDTDIANKPEYYKKLLQWAETAP